MASAILAKNVRSIPVVTISDRHLQLTSRVIILAAVAAAFSAGWIATGTQDTAHATALAGPDLTRLLRAMAALKALMACAAIAGVLWRLGAPVTLPAIALYAASAAAMAAGPALIWRMDHVGLGALLLHGGLLAGILLLWRDPAVGKRLAGIIEARRRAIAQPA